MYYCQLKQLEKLPSTTAKFPSESDENRFHSPVIQLIGLELKISNTH